MSNQNPKFLMDRRLAWMLSLGAGIIGGLLGTLIVLNIKDILITQQLLDIGTTVSIANTYIVYTTLIFVVATILLAAFGIYLSKWFATTKESEFKNLVDDLHHLMDKNPELADKFVREIFRHENTQKFLEKELAERERNIAQMAKDEKIDPEEISP